MTAHPDLPPSTRPTLSWRTLRAGMRRFARERSLMEFLATLPPPTRQYLHEAFIGNGGAHQRAPDEAAAWHTWLILGGRGAGKTRAGAEWVSGMALGLLGIAERRRDAHRARRRDARRRARRDGRTAPRGSSRRRTGRERPRWQPSLRRLEWPYGRRRARLLGRGPGLPARAAVRGRLGGRARQVALCARDLGHAAVRRCGSAPARARS